MYKIKAKLVAYCLAYFLPVRIPETGVSNTLIMIRTSRHQLAYTFYMNYILLTLGIYLQGSKEAVVTKSMARYTIVAHLSIPVVKSNHYNHLYK